MRIQSQNIFFAKYNQKNICDRGRVMCVRVCSVMTAALLLSNCAIHPVPENVTGVDTYHIVRQIRWETREAAAQLVLRELRRLGTDHPDQAADPIAKALVVKYEADPELISTFTPNLFPG